jgi:hypothetical protein
VTDEQGVRVVRSVNIDIRLYEQVIVTAAMMGIDPGTLVEEATVYFMVNAKEKLLERVQERIDSIFADLDSLPHRNLPEVAGAPND